MNIETMSEIKFYVTLIDTLLSGDGKEKEGASKEKFESFGQSGVTMSGGNGNWTLIHWRKKE